MMIRILSGAGYSVRRKYNEGYGIFGTAHRLPQVLILYNARMALSSRPFSPMPILLNLSRIILTFFSVDCIRTVHTWLVTR